MKLICLGSGSSGNCYLLENETECLILDAGIPIKAVKKALDFNISKIVGVCVTHCHKDHSQAVKDFEQLGIEVFKPYEGGKQSIKLGNFKINAFNVPHDGVENRGFLIQHDDIGKMLYMTDLEYCPYNFKKHKVNHMLIEANYSREYVSDEVSKRNHVLKGHAEINTSLGIIEANMTDSLETVILCHLSQESADAREFLNKVQKIVNKAVLVDFADKGKQWELTNKGKCPF